MKLNVKAFAIACGLTWGLGVFFLTWWIMLFEGSTHEIIFLGRIYRGFNISPIGSIIGLIWALADGAIGGAIFAWLYNLITKKTNQACRKKPATYDFSNLQYNERRFNMNITAAKAFFLWCTIINVAMLMLSFLACTFLGDFCYRMNSRWFPISKETFDVIFYSFIALHKLFIWVFNIVPYIALVIIGKNKNIKN